jgi:phage terminase Nu1 subunit (DNA packaging protein)
MPEGSGAGARETEEKKFIFSTADTCEFFGISRETLSTWQKKGAPKEARGKWDIKAVMEWRYDGRHVDSPETRKLKAEADLKEAKAAQEKIKLGVTKDEFIHTDVMKAELMRLFANMKKSLLAISHDVAADMATLDAEAAEIAKSKVDKRIHDALQELTEGRNYRAKAKKKAK